MEEEGIYYYFEHAAGSHKLVISDRPQFNRNVPGRGELHFRDNTDEHIEIFSSTMIREWGTDFKIGPGLFSFRDHNIQQPGKKLATSSKTKLTAGDSAAWEVYDYPGGYAKKYDGVDPGGEKRGDLDNIIPDGKRTAQIASEVLDAGFKTARAKSDCSSLIAGYLFKLIKHPVKDENGQYVVTSIRHSASQSPAYDQNDATYDTDGEAYVNEFRALAHARSGAVPFRPEPVTPRPIIYGAQTAVVVGTSGEEIYTDEYGRIKVQFHWDRSGMSDGSDSCWLPVAQTWAGNGWGSVYIPRVGMEVIVHFMEGDPDQPFVSGCIYNPGNMPPYKLPKEKTKSTIKTDSSKGGNGFNEIRFEDKKGSEQVFVHAQKSLDVRVKADRREWIGNDRHLIVHRDRYETVERDEHRVVDRHVYESIGVKGAGDYHREVKGKMALKTGGGVSHEIGGSLGEKIGLDHSEEVGMNLYLKAGLTAVIEAGVQLTLKVGGNFIDINPAGVTIQGTMVLINSGGAAGSGKAVGLVSPTKPEETHIADNADPGSKAPTYKNQIEEMPKRKLPTYKKPSHRPDPKKKSWIEVLLEDEKGDPVPGEKYRVTLPDGETIAEGTTDDKGLGRVSGIDPGNCKITFPELDKDAWNPK
jgi:type VI secretion system secreted protein VgrG